MAKRILRSSWGTNQVGLLYVSYDGENLQDYIDAEYGEFIGRQTDLHRFLIFRWENRFMGLRIAIETEFTEVTETLKELLCSKKLF